jgi:hypothetical protein
MGDQTVSATLTLTPAAGWYGDPSDAGALRWWDGGSWTDHVRPAAEPVVAQPVVAPVIAAPVAAAPVAAPPVAAPAVVAQPISQPIAQPVAQPVDVQPVIPQPVAPSAAQVPIPQPVAQPVAPQPVPQPSLAPVAQFVPAPVAQPAVPFVAPSVTPRGVLPGMQTAAPRPTFSTQVLWPDLGSPQTAGVWLLASLPLLSIALQIGVGFGLGVLQAVTGVVVPIPNLVFIVILLACAWIFAAADAATLRRRGYQPPSIGWMWLLPPLAYLIARGKAVRREGKKAWPPELFYFLSIFGIAGLSVAYYLLVVTAMGGVDGLLALAAPGV